MTATELLLPKINTNDNTVELAHWYVEDGERVEAGADLVDVSSSKAVVTLPAEKSGYVLRRWAVGEEVAVGAVLASIFGDRAQYEAAKKAAASGERPRAGARPPATATSGSFAGTRFSKAALEHLAQSGLDPAHYQGAGLVSRRHLTGADSHETEAHLARGGSGSLEMPLPTFAAGMRASKTPKIKKLEIEALTSGQMGNVNSSLTVEFRSAGVRRALRELDAFNGQVLPLILFEFSRLLEKEPFFTAFYNAGHVYHYDQVNLGVAIDLGRGLRVAVVREANRLLPIELYERVTDFTLRYMDNKLTEEDLTGGSVTVTDLSSQNIRAFQPLINQHQAVILGVGGDAGLEGHPMSLTLVFDHRVLTGREVATFLAELKERLLNYEKVTTA